MRGDFVLIRRFGSDSMFMLFSPLQGSARLWVKDCMRRGYRGRAAVDRIYFTAFLHCFETFFKDMLIYCVYSVLPECTAVLWSKKHQVSF